MRKGRLHAVKTQADRLHAMLENLEDSARNRLEQLQDGVHTGVRATKRAAHNVDRLSHKRPWMMIGTFSAVSLILGFLLGKKRKNDE